MQENDKLINKKNIVVGALQPGYLPWLGFFDQICQSDIFILYDDMQYNRYSWRNRNRIKGAHGETWLTVPVKRNPGQLISKARTDNTKNWQKKHWKTILQCYINAPFFKKHSPFFEEVYHTPWEYLCELDIKIIQYIVKELGIKTKILRSSELGLEERFRKQGYIKDRKTERIIFFMKELNANLFFEGAKGKEYINEEMLKDVNLKIEFQDYIHPAYNQQFENFIPYLSVVDLLFNHGDESLDILTGRIE